MDTFFFFQILFIFFFSNFNFFVFRSLRDGLAPDLTVQEALDLLFGQEDPVVDTVYIAPPPAAVESDEDSCDEDTGGLADNLNHGCRSYGSKFVCLQNSY